MIWHIVCSNGHGEDVYLARQFADVRLGDRLYLKCRCGCDRVVTGRSVGIAYAYKLIGV